MGIETVIGVVSAVGAVASGAAALKSAFTKPKAAKAAEFMATPKAKTAAVTPDVLSPEDKDPSRRNLAKFGPLVATSPLGLTDDPMLGRSKLLGN